MDRTGKGVELMLARCAPLPRSLCRSDKTELIRLTHYPWRNDALKAAATRKPLTGAAWSRMDVGACLRAPSLFPPVLKKDTNCRSPLALFTLCYSCS